MKRLVDSLSVKVSVYRAIGENLLIFKPAIWHDEISDKDVKKIESFGLKCPFEICKANASKIWKNPELQLKYPNGKVPRKIQHPNNPLQPGK